DHRRAVRRYGRANRAGCREPGVARRRDPRRRGAGHRRNRPVACVAGPPEGRRRGVRFARERAGSRRLARPASLLAALAILAAVALPGAVAAHARLVSGAPAAGATLGSAPAGVTLTFSETPDPKLTSVKVLDKAGTDYVSG